MENTLKVGTLNRVELGGNKMFQAMDMLRTMGGFGKVTMKEIDTLSAYLAQHPMVSSITRAKITAIIGR